MNFQWIPGTKGLIAIMMYLNISKTLDRETVFFFIEEPVTFSESLAVLKFC